MASSDSSAASENAADATSRVTVLNTCMGVLDEAVDQQACKSEGPPQECDDERNGDTRYLFGAILALFAEYTDTGGGAWRTTFFMCTGISASATNTVVTPATRVTLPTRAAAPRWATSSLGCARRDSAIGREETAIGFHFFITVMVVDSGA